jgi:hypothetical protein
VGGEEKREGEREGREATKGVSSVGPRNSRSLNKHVYDYHFWMK